MVFKFIKSKITTLVKQFQKEKCPHCDTQLTKEVSENSILYYCWTCGYHFEKEVESK